MPNYTCRLFILISIISLVRTTHLPDVDRESWDILVVRVTVLLSLRADIWIWVHQPKLRALRRVNLYNLVQSSPWASSLTKSNARSGRKTCSIRSNGNCVDAAGPRK